MKFRVIIIVGFTINMFSVSLTSFMSYCNYVCCEFYFIFIT